jgi:hypothetical protein
MSKHQITIYGLDEDTFEEIKALNIEGVEYRSHLMFDDISTPDLIALYIPLAYGVIQLVTAAIQLKRAAHQLKASQKENNYPVTVVITTESEITTDLKNLLTKKNEQIKIKIE